MIPRSTVWTIQPSTLFSQALEDTYFLVYRPAMNEESAFCPVFEAINLLQEKWTLHIIRSLLNGPAGFNELRRSIGNCNTTTLSERLESLTRNGLVAKTVQSVMPPRTSYALTLAGEDLGQVIGAIDRWSQQHLSPENWIGAPGERVA